MSGQTAAHIRLCIDPLRDVTHAHPDPVEYSLWVPGGDVVRLVCRDGAWRFVKPYETWLGKDDDKPKVGTQSFRIRISVSGSNFRTQDGNSVLKRVYADTTGVSKQDHVKRNVKAFVDGGSDELDIYLSTSVPDSSTAFGLNTFTLARRHMHTRVKCWQWVSAALVTWDMLSSPDPTFALTTFMWSDIRMKVANVNRSTEMLVVHVVSNSIHDRTYDTTAEDVRSVVETYTLPEFMALHASSLPPEFLSHPKYEGQNDVRTSTLNTHLEGLRYDLKGVKLGGDGEDVGNELMGASAQSWYVWTGSVVEESWILEKMAQVAWLHQYDLGRYVKDVDRLLGAAANNTIWSDETSNDYHLFQRLLTDVVRLVTMHATSSPYAEDMRWKNDEEATSSDTYTSALTVPGDCEDGAQAAYTIYMSILFGKEWKNPKVLALRKLAAFLGMPVCITGTSTNPMKPGQGGGTHAYGAIIPFPRFVAALFGKDNGAAKGAAFKKFEERFGYACPDYAGELDVSSIETTLFATPLARFHAHHPGVEREKHEIMKTYVKEELGEKMCAAINVSYNFILDSDCACHLLAFKAFTSAHREMFYSGGRFAHVPRTLDGTDSTEYSCSFVFSRPAGGIGIKRTELYLVEQDIGWELKAPQSMSKRVWDADARLILNTRQPVVKLVPRLVDPMKHTDMNFVVHMNHANAFDYSKPHVYVFVFDAAHEYEGVTAHEKMNELKDELGAKSMVVGMYDKSLVYVFTFYE